MTKAVSKRHWEDSFPSVLNKLQKLRDKNTQAMNEIEILKRNVADLQKQYQKALIKIKGETNG